MAYYRLYFMTRKGHIKHFEEFEGPDDGAALQWASDQSGEMGMELWCQRRKVRRFEAAAAPVLRAAE